MIKIVDLSRTFNGHAVLDGINLEILQGEITVIIGKSGVGKSVLLKHIIGLLKPDRGQIIIDGQDITRARGAALKALKQRFAYLFQGGALFDSLPVFENVAFPLREKTKLPEAEIISRTKERLAQVALSKEVENKYPDELSGGMKKRVALARALIQEPEIILFDEPVTGLDPPMTNTVFHLISKTHQESGYTALIVSHDIPEIFGIADHVAMLHKGRIIAYGSPEDIQRETNPVVQHFIQGEPDFLEE
ncbi:MAG: ABC transporter ATP-binding protein [Desulfobacca sp. 4484_104]|nr:MAG: ABC transporter ATP-binding protein [Desulfobacca sp. 4484_104]RLA88676.1 MAG: ABC transporter ATP-binding protein [Deltaproteobacteria bacterium]